MRDNARVRARGTSLLWGLFLALSMVLPPEVAGAQALRPDEAAQLLQQLQSQRGTRPGGEPLYRPSPVDQVREQARQRAPRGATGATVDPFDPRALLAPADGTQPSRQLPQGLSGYPTDAEPSPLEFDYSSRAGEDLTQYGYDAFRRGAPADGGLIGAVRDDYRIGIGDELVITFHGTDSRSYRTQVDREGRVILPQLPPIPAAGRTFGEFRADLEARTEATLLETAVYVSLGSVRQISVMVIGEVAEPGLYQLTGQASAIDALVAAGGIKKTGSLRRIQVARGAGGFVIDAYDLLFNGRAGRDVSLAHGDRLVVPLVGETIAIAGKVKRPAIYELADGDRGASLARILALAGGPLRPSGNRILHVRQQNDGQEQLTEVPDPRTVTALGGDLLRVEFGQDVMIGSARLAGHVRVPGTRAVERATTVADLIGDGSVLQADPYLLFGVVRTTDPRSRAYHFEPINLERVLAGRENRRLVSDDVLIVLGREDIRFLNGLAVQAVIGGATEQFNAQIDSELAQQGPQPPQRPSAQQGGQPLPSASARQDLQQPPPQRPAKQAPRSEFTERAASPSSPGLEDCAGLRLLAQAQAAGRPGRFAVARRVEVALRQSVRDTAVCRPVFDQFPDLLAFVLEHAVALEGEVRLPGIYPLAAEAPLSALVSAAGGAAREVDLTKVEVSHFPMDAQTGTSAVERRMLNVSQSGFSAVAVAPGDIVRLHGTFTDREEGLVLVSGEVLRPGYYDIRRGERLSELLARAGGLTPQAYPYGSVFTRERVKRQERLGLDLAARELEAAVGTALANQRQGADQGRETVSVAQALSRSLRSVEPIGRVVVESDPTVLQVRPELDTTLEPGDTLLVPKRPNSVTVVGDVMNPITLQFQPGKQPGQYIREAGGMRPSADGDRVFVVFPNGASQPTGVSAFDFSPLQVPPGSTVVVPKEPAPFNLTGFLRDGTDILSKLAITAASLVAINRD